MIIDYFLLKNEELGRQTDHPRKNYRPKFQPYKAKFFMHAHILH